MASDQTIKLSDDAPLGSVSEREAMRRERAAYLTGSCKTATPCAMCIDRAAQLYPLPKVSRPRVLRWHSNAFNMPVCFTLLNGVLHYGYGPGAHPRTSAKIEIARGNESVALDFALFAKAQAELFANPTELVEDDGSEQMGGAR